MTDQLREAASQPQPGLTKREEFAARALVALIPASIDLTEFTRHAWAARQAVAYADALLAALARKE